MILDDFVMLGTTVPEPNSDGRVFVCSAGLSGEFGKLVRIYPLARRNIPKRWGVYRVPVERNPKDSRDESFQVSGDRRPGWHERINDRFQVVRKELPKSERTDLLESHVIGSVYEANQRSRSAKTARERFSLAIIHPELIEVGFEDNLDSPDAAQQALFDDYKQQVTGGAKRFALIPRIHFKDELGWNHLMLRDWGTFELQRKHGADYFRQNLVGALHLDENSSLLVGNMSNRRTTWLVISVLNGIRGEPTLFDSVDPRKKIPDKVRREVYARDEWKCVDCGGSDRLTVDHKLPHSKGGSDDITNLQTLCWSCNLAKSDRT